MNKVYNLYSSLKFALLNNKNLYIYMLSKVFSSVIIAVTGIFIARYFSKEDFGLLKTVITFLGFVSIFISFGLNDYFLIKFSKQKNNFKLISKVLGTFSILYFLFFPVSLILYNFFYDKGLIFLIILYIGILIGNISSIINIIFQVFDKFKLLSLLTFLNAISYLVLVYFFISFIRGDLKDYFYILLFISFLNLFINLYFFSKISKLKYLIFRPTFNINILRYSFPFFISGLTSFIYMQSDILLLSILKNTEEVARYSIPVTFINASYLIPTILYNYFIPKLSMSFNSKNFKFHYKNFLKFNTFFSIPLFIILFFFGEHLLVFLFTEKYIDSLPILQMLSIVFLFHSFCFIFGGILTASNNQKIRTYIQSTGAILNIILNLLFIPYFGAEGAAMTTMLTEIIIFIGYLYFGRKYI